MYGGRSDKCVPVLIEIVQPIKRQECQAIRVISCEFGIAGMFLAM